MLRELVYTFIVALDTFHCYILLFNLYSHCDLTNMLLTKGLQKTWNAGIMEYISTFNIFIQKPKLSLHYSWKALYVYIKMLATVYL